MPKSSKERLYADLQRRILTLDLAPGTHLDETRLSTEYGVSRTPLREVFRQLAGEGYIEMRDNRGTIVAPMSYRAMRDFFQTAPLIYSAVARLAAENATPRRVLELEGIQSEFRQAVETDSVEDLVFWNDRFHLRIGEMAENAYLLPSLRRLLIDHARIGQTFWRARTSEQAARIRTAAEQHDRLIAVLAAGDAEAAVALTREHWALSRAHMDVFVRPDPLPEDAASEM